MASDVLASRNSIPLNGTYWEFLFDSRPTNLTWTWRHVSATGGAIGRSSPFKDFGQTMQDALCRGFSPAYDNWILRGAPVDVELAAEGYIRQGSARPAAGEYRRAAAG